MTLFDLVGSLSAFCAFWAFGCSERSNVCPTALFVRPSRHTFFYLAVAFDSTSQYPSFCDSPGSFTYDDKRGDRIRSYLVRNFCSHIHVFVLTNFFYFDCTCNRNSNEMHMKLKTVLSCIMCLTGWLWVLVAYFIWYLVYISTSYWNHKLRVSSLVAIFFIISLKWLIIIKRERENVGEGFLVSNVCFDDDKYINVINDNW